MRMKIKAEKVANGWVMVAITENKKEYPQEGLVLRSKKEVYKQAKCLYGNTKTWDYNPITHTIKID